MSKRDSGYERKPRDAYETPSWVTEVLRGHIPSWVKLIWEPACGSGKMVRALQGMGYDVIGTDIAAGMDFLEQGPGLCDAVITNSPYALAAEFIEHCVAIGIPYFAMLLSVDFDSAKTRRHLFADHPHFAKKIVLTQRIRWFEGSSGAPSENHAWYIWDHQHRGPVELAYGP